MANSISLPLSTTVTAAIGRPISKLFGFTSPKAKVELSGINTQAYTYADSTGYFQFTNFSLSQVAQDLCLISSSDVSLATQPVCFPGPPKLSTNSQIGPIILPPSLALSTNTPQPNDTLILSGQAIPNQEIKIYLFQSEKSFNLIPVANAANHPVFTAQSDLKGNYSLSLPTIYSGHFKLFTQLTFNQQPSPNSNFLHYQLGPTSTFSFTTLLFLVMLNFVLASLFVLTFKTKRHHWLALYPKTLLWPKPNI